MKTLTTRRVPPLTAVGMLGVLAAAGCSDDPVDPCHHRVCSIESPACVEQVAQTMACRLEIDDVTLPVVRFLTADEVVAEAMATREEPTADQVRDITDYYRGEAMVGLMPPTYQYGDEDYSFVDWAIAYYSTDTKEVVIITDNVGDDVERAYLTFVHEMVHVYQDELRGIEALVDEHAPTVDRFLGLRAMIEGQAELHESYAELELLELSPDRVDWYDYFERYQTSVLETAAESEEPSFTVFGTFPYPFGQEFVYEAFQDGGRPGIEALFTMPPDSVRQVMAGYDAWPDEAKNRDDRLAPHAGPVLPEQYEFLNGGHQGVWLINAMLQRTAGSSELWAEWELGAISADHLSIFREQDTGELVAVWRIQVDGAAALSSALLAPGSEWTDAVDQPTSHWVTTIDGDLVLIATSSGDARDVLALIEGWQSVEALYASAGRAPDARFGLQPMPQHVHPSAADRG